MRKIYILISLIFSISSIGLAQVPHSAIFPNIDNKSTHLIDCMGQTQDAGTFQLGDYKDLSLSNDISKKRIFLCAQDRVPLIHDRNAILEGDPNPATEAGVGYGFYSCPPSVDGSNLSDVAADPCHVTSPPPPTGDFYVIVDGNIQGDLLLNNDGSLNQNFNGGAPGTWWFAPITFDNVVVNNGSYMAEYEIGNENQGPCVNVRTDEAIEVTYLTPFELSNITTSKGDGEECEGSFILTGGLPEYDNTSFYTLSIVSSSNKNNVATIQGSNYTHGDKVEFIAPIGGEYIVRIEDGKSCIQTFTVDLDCNCVEFELPDIEVLPGEEFCIPIKVNNFDSLISMSFTFEFDPSIIQFTGFQGFDIPSDKSISGVGDSKKNQGIISFLWSAVFNPDIQPLTLPDGTTIIEFCFRVHDKARLGDISHLFFGNQITFIEAYTVDSEGRSIEKCVKYNEGSVTVISESGLIFDWVSCGSAPGEMVGTFTMTAFGGTPPYSINWAADFSGGGSGNGTIVTEGGTYTVDGLDYGGYNVTLTDSDGNTYTEKIIISDDRPHPGFDIIVINPACHDRTNGRLILDNIVASEPYTIEWSTGQFNNTQIRNLAAGRYSVTVTDMYGCSAEAMRVVKYDPIKIEKEISEVSCQGMEDGSITLTVSGGVPIDGGGYIYKFESGEQFTGNQVFRGNLAYGWHMITITDDNNCATSDSFFIEASKKLFLEDVVLDEPTCYGDNNGSISISPRTEGAMPATPYTIAINGIDVSYSETQTGIDNLTFTNVPSGQLLITVADRAGCSFDTLITLNQPDPITINEEIHNNTCESARNVGSIRLNATGGTGTLSYEWDGGNYFPPPTDYIRNLPAGTYRVTVTDENDCEFTGRYVIDEPEGPIIDHIDRILISCAGNCDGELSITATAGDVPIVDYFWINEDQDTLRGQTISNLCSGLYDAFVIDEKGCIDTRIINLPDPDSIEIETIQLNDPLCANQNSGSIRINVSGGTMPYSYNWNIINAPDSSLLDNIGAGTYTVSITDAEGCGPLVQNFTLNDPPKITLSFSDINGTSCYNTCDGSVTVSASGGISNGPFLFEWEDGTAGLSNSNLCGGERFVIVTDPICTDTFYFNIPSPNAISFNWIDSIPPTCNGETDGRIEIVGTGGTETFIYFWEDLSIHPYHDNLAAGDYGLTITDGNACTLDTIITLGEPDILTTQIDSVANISCPGETDGYISLNVTGGNGGYVYHWSENISDSAVASNLQNGQYSVTVVDSKGCSDTLSTTVSLPPKIVYELDEIIDPTCNGEETSLNILNSSGGNGGPYLANINNQEFSVPGSIDVPAGNYILSIYDRNGCVVDTNIIISEPPAIFIDMPSFIEVNLGDETSLNPTITNITAPVDSYTWTPTEIVDCATCKNVSFVLVDNATLTLQVIDENGCTGEKTIEIRVNKARNVYIPTAFTPNGDGVNDVFKIFVNSSVETIEFFQIYNRWGSKIWEGSHIPIINNASAIGWDGTAQGRSMDPGVYVFTAKIRFKDGVTRLYSGDITILDRDGYE